MNTLKQLLLSLSIAITLSACLSDAPNRAPVEAQTPPAKIEASSVPEQKQHTDAFAKRSLEPIVVGERAHQSAPVPASGSVSSLSDLRYASEPTNRENYRHFDDNPVKRAAETPVSTFSIDVDTGAYANVRRFLRQGQLPVQDAVRVEEMINYFSYDYPLPRDKSRPFSVTTEIAPAPWSRHAHLLRIGLKGYDITPEQLPPANLVFLVDVSGSMMPQEKLPLLVSGLKLLVQNLRAQDRVAIAVYAGASGTVLESTPGDQKAKIVAALERLSAGGSTNGGAGIRLAYALAEQSYIKNGINRVLLATDGDFNVGTVSFEALKNMIEEKRKSGISLTTLGFGMGNYNDHLMEQLADAGNGNYAYIDTLNEAHKVLVGEVSSTLQTIAKDVKIQLEFNPAVVAEYRLIGYENRALRREDFHNDKIDAGDIGAGHTVTALYEIVLTGSDGQRIEPLRYGAANVSEGKAEELAWLRLRYKSPEVEQSQLIEQPIARAAIKRELREASADMRFATVVAAFGQLLRGGKYIGDFNYDDAIRLAQEARGKDAYGYRGEFIGLLNLAKTLDGGNRSAKR